MAKVIQNDLIKQYFIENPNRNIAYPEIVDWATATYEHLTDEKFRDPDRAIRKLAQQGFLIKVSKGVYRYHPEHARHRALQDFSEAQKNAIFERDGYICAMCGKDKKHYPNAEFHIDHIIPKDQEGKAILENGQVLCSRCNFIKKNLNQTSTGKKMFVNLYKLAKKEGNAEVELFCKELLDVFEKFDVNGHIEWER